VCFRTLSLGGVSNGRIVITVGRVCERQLVQGRELGGFEERLRGVEEEPAFFAGCADDESRVLQRLESMAPVRALQFEKSSGGGQALGGRRRRPSRQLVRP
jgi:hypothetical protein